MKITDALLGEHGVFYAQFSHLEKVVPQLEDLTLVCYSPLWSPTWARAGRWQ
jgi:hypothetical protein